MASWLVGAGSERQVIAVVCGIGDVCDYRVVVPYCLETLCEERCERGVFVHGEGGGPSTIVFEEARCGICCHVRFLGRALDYVH